jgi:IclR family acetate operon transcriptional repressor
VVSGGPAPAVQQAFALLDAVAANESPMRLRDLVEATGLVKSTTHRLARTLVELDVLASDDRYYRLGPRLNRYGAGSDNDSSLDVKEIE